MKKIFSRWDVMRFVRLALGIMIVVQAVQSREWLLALGGVLFTLMPIFNIGCCGTNSCATLYTKQNKQQNTIEYEEIK